VGPTSAPTGIFFGIALANQVEVRIKLFDNPADLWFSTSVEMKTTFAKQVTMHTPSNGWMAICQRASRLLGVVGMKF
jgi:hypothetical protein